MDKVFDLSGTPATPLKCYEGLRPRMCATKEWIEANRLRLSVDEDTMCEAIRIKQEDNEPWGIEVLVHYLPFEKAKHFMTANSAAPYVDKPETWHQITDVAEAAQDFLDYMNLAWIKAREKRPATSARSVRKLSTYLWLLNRIDLGAILYDENYLKPHIKPAMTKICEEMGIMVPMEVRADFVAPKSSIILPNS